MGYVKPFEFPINVFGVLFRLILIHFDHCKNKIQIFIFLPFHRLYMGSEVTVGSEDPLHFFKGIFVQDGSSGTLFDHGQSEIKTFLIYTPP